MRIDFVADVACPWCAIGLAALERAIEHHSRRVQPQEFAGRGWLRRAVNWIAYGVVRFGAVALAGGRDY